MTIANRKHMQMTRERKQDKAKRAATRNDISPAELSHSCYFPLFLDKLGLKCLKEMFFSEEVCN